MKKDFIAGHWYADIYEQFENQTNDVEYLINILKEKLGDTNRTILEVACGGGRICIPLAQEGYEVTGFDADEHMLMRCYRRMKNLGNITCCKADAVTSGWEKDFKNFDVVVIAGNFLINIECDSGFGLESDIRYSEAQETIIRKSALSLKSGGHLYLDFDLHHNPQSFFSRLGESSYFNGTDDMGTYGRTVSCGSVYDPATQICAGSSHIEIIKNNGEKYVIPSFWHKHIPTQGQVYGWLEKAGFEIECVYKNHTNEQLPEPADESTHRATVWARKK